MCRKTFKAVKLLGVCEKTVEKSTGTNMNIKVHFLHSHLDEFLDNCSDASDEQELLHQDIKTMENRNQGQWKK